jgi:hypothetical protein
MTDSIGFDLHPNPESTFLFDEALASFCPEVFDLDSSADAEAEELSFSSTTHAFADVFPDDFLGIGSEPLESKEQVSKYSFIGSIASVLNFHGQYCKHPDDEECVCFQDVEEVELQLASISLDKALCTCKKDAPPLVVSTFAGIVLGCVPQSVSNCVAPLIEAGFVRVSGRMDKREKFFSSPPFRIDVEANLDFISFSLELITRDQVTAFLDLQQILTADDMESTGYNLIFQSNCESLKQLQGRFLDSKPEPVLCWHCQNEAISKESRKRVEFKPSKQSVKKSADIASAKTLLEKRRRDRALKQVVNCEPAEMPSMVKAIQDFSTACYKMLRSELLNSESIEEKNPENRKWALDKITSYRDEFFEGCEPLEKLGCLLGLTRAIYKRTGLLGRENYADEIRTILHTWREILGISSSWSVDKNHKKVGSPLGKWIAENLCSIGTEHPDAIQDFAIFKSVFIKSLK